MFVLLLLFALTNVNTAKLTPEIKIPQGTLTGYYDKTITGKTIQAYEGIPYAKPPIGKLRFKEPQPPTKWNGTWQADTLYACLQYFQFVKPGEDRVKGEEDCLYLNVYTHEASVNRNRDVIIHIHGGCFMFNSGASFGHRIIMERDIVFVSINYRLGPIGFLSTEDAVLPGNNGLKDQVFALKWIKKNIKYFGGNPDSITLTGMSAGSASVHLHFLSPLSTGLFDKGIALSGSSLNPWVLAENSLEKARKLASIVGCPTEKTNELVKCLSKRPGRQIVGAVKHFQHWLYNPYSPFGVVVDKWSEKPFLPEHPYVLLKKGRVQDLPIIFAQTNDEGLYPGGEFYADDYLKEIDEKWNELMPQILDYNYTSFSEETKNSVSEKIRKHYFNNSPVDKEHFSQLIKALSDRLFVEGIEKAVILQSQAVTSSIYYYHFNYRGAHSLSELLAQSTDNIGVSHGDDLIYILSYPGLNTQSNDEDRKMSRIMLDIWTAFAKSKIPEIEGVEWKAVSKSDEAGPLDILFINTPTNITMAAVESLGDRQFWDGLPLRENERLIKGVKDEL